MPKSLSQAGYLFFSVYENRWAFIWFPEFISV